jgi:prophage antirepressor-like protein
MTTDGLSVLDFAFEARPVRVVIRDGAPWWVAMDVCRILGIKSPERAYARIPDDEKTLVSHPDAIMRETRDGKKRALPPLQDVLVVSEPGLYRLIFRSDKPEAERLRRWVFGEVLPAIRRTGRYGAAEAGGLRQVGQEAYALELPPGSWTISTEAPCATYHPETGEMVVALSAGARVHRARVMSRQEVAGQEGLLRPLLLSEGQARKAELLDDIVKIEDGAVRRRMAEHVRLLTDM